MLGIAQGLQRLLIARHGFDDATSMMMLWRRYTGLGDTQLGTGRGHILAAVARAIPFELTPLFGLAGCWPDTSSREGPKE